MQWLDQRLAHIRVLAVQLKALVKMGHGASIPASCDALFVNQELMDGGKALVENETLRSAFVSYIKSGAWVDKLATLVPTCKAMLFNEGMLAGLELTLDKEPVRKYKVPAAKVNDIGRACLRGDLDTLLSRTTLNSFMSISSPSHGHLDSFNDSYNNMEDCKCFTADQMVSILFNVLFPIFKVSSTHENVKWGSSIGCLNSTNPPEMNVLYPKSSQRIIDVLLGCAAYFEKSDLLSRLQQPSWLSSIVQAVDNYALGITISDVTTTGDPIVYSNKAFQFSFGYTSDEITSTNIAILNGPATEPEQIAIIHAAMCERKSVKVGVTHHTNSGAAVLNLVAIRAVGRYSVAVHLPVTKTARMEDLGVSMR